MLGLSANNLFESLTSGYCNSGFDDRDIVSLQILLCNIYGFKYLAAPSGERRFCGDKESTIRTQSACVAFHLGNAHIQAKTLIKKSNHKGAIGRASSKSGLHRNTFYQMGMNAGQFKILRQQCVSLYYKVVFLITIDRVSCNFQVARLVRREVVVHEFNFKCIGKGNGIKDGFKIVIAIFAFGSNVKAKINFGTRKCQHVETRY